MITASPTPPPHSVIDTTEHWVGKYFRDLGTEIERRIQGTSVTSDSFADVATAVLKEHAPQQTIDAGAMAEWMSSGAPLPPQVNFHAGFGQPPLTVYVSKLFYFEVLFWFPSRTSIHGHGFSGAFRVLDGYSIQTTYAFTETEVLAQGLRLGELRPRDVELLLPGDVCDIRSLEAFVHSVVHMGYPSLTLVARTFAEIDATQYDYFRCGVAYTAFHRKQELTRQLDVLLAFARRDPVAAKENLKSYLQRQDDFGRFATCMRLANRADSFALEVIEWAIGQWSRTIMLARQVAEEGQRTFRIYQNVGQLPTAQAQLLAVLGELFGTRDDVMRTLKAFYPAVSPEEKLTEWSNRVPAPPQLAVLPSARPKA